MVKNVLGPTIIALARTFFAVSKAASISRSVFARRMWICCPTARAASCTSFNWVSNVGQLGLSSTAISVVAGTISRSSPSRFAPSTSTNKATPVTFARPVVTFHQTQFDGVFAAGENNRDGRRGRLRRQRGRGTAGTNHRNLSAHELACELRQSIHLTFRPAIFDADIAVLDVTGLT